eukprot:5636156-Pyramimonas_sp.AAC.1
MATCQVELSRSRPEPFCAYPARIRCRIRVMFRQPTVVGDRPPQPYRMVRIPGQRIGLMAVDPGLITEYGGVVLTDVLRPCTDFRLDRTFPGKCHVTHELRCVDAVDRYFDPAIDMPIPTLFCI